MNPKPELRGQPFTMHPASESQRTVSAPGFEDWTTGQQELVLIRRNPGWRPYLRETIESYDTSFGRGGHCVHYRTRVIRSAVDGKPLGFAPTAAVALERLQAAFLAEEVMPT